MAIATYLVEGMTCEHCVQAVRQELTALPGVRDVEIRLGHGKPSSVQVTSDTALDENVVREAVDESGYNLIP